MAVFYPSIDVINHFKVRPTEGEISLLNFLYNVLDDSFEVYFNPFLNGDRPDVIIMRRNYGVLIIEVKDWNLDNYRLNEKKKWVFTPNESVVKSPIDQVLKYKSNLFDLHVPELLQHKIDDIRHFGIVSCALYFHCASKHQVDSLLVDPYKNDDKYQKFLKYNIDLLGKDSLEEEYFVSILKKRYMMAARPSFLFTDQLYDNFKRILSPSVHLKNSGIPYNYDRKQLEVIYSEKLEQRVKGVFGSGKTTVLAARAVQAYKRALRRNNYPRILILTYNITLKNFIHDKLNNVDEEFPLENFIIINYHHFINGELNNLGVDVVPPPEGLTPEEISRYFEENYYGNVGLFESLQSEIVKYDAVFIDEIQDYHRSWMDIIKNFFRDPDGDYVLFGDVKQNIYANAIKGKDVVTNVIGVNELKVCYRSGSKVQDLAKSYQNDVFGEKYYVDDFSSQLDGTYEFFGHRIEKEGYMNYMYLKGENVIPALFNVVWGNIQNKNKDISPNDITIMGYTSSLLRKFDLYYRYASREKTNLMMEDVESMYLFHLNKMGRESDDNPNKKWFTNIIDHIKSKLYPNRDRLYENDVVKLRKVISKLFAIYDLYTEFGLIFKDRLSEECKKSGISLESFLAFRKHYAQLIDPFVSEVYNGDYKSIRDNKKLHFYMNSGTVKISTINSFKGWESEVVFVIIEPTYLGQSTFNMAADELLYTGITRCIKNLVVVNFGNEDYDSKIRPLIERIK